MDVATCIVKLQYKLPLSAFKGNEIDQAGYINRNFLSQEGNLDLVSTWLQDQIWQNFYREF